MPGRWGDDDSDSDDELTVDAIRRARAKRQGGGQAQVQLEAQTNEVSKRALSSTQRALKQLEQTQQIGAATLENMHSQVGILRHRRCIGGPQPCHLRLIDVVRRTIN